MYRRHTMETVQYQDRTTATSNLWLTQIKIRGKQTAVLQTFFGCGNDGPVKVIWLHECSEGLKFSEVLRSLSVQVWRLSGRQMLRCAWWKNISCGRSPSTRQDISSSCTWLWWQQPPQHHAWLLYFRGVHQSLSSLNGFVHLWTKTWSKSLKPDVN